MKPGYAPLVLIAALAGCVERETPTSPVIEQAVFNAFGGLAVGEFVSFAGPAAAEVLVGGSAGVGDYVLIPFHASKARGTNLRVEVSGQEVGPRTSLAPAPAVAADAGLRLDPLLHPSSAMHEALHERQKRAVAPLLRTFEPSLSRSPGGIPAARSDLGGGRARVGQVVDINANAFGPACTADDRRTGRVEAITTHAIIVGDTANPAGGFTRADYEEFGRQFDQLVYPTVTNNFAEPTDIDGNGRVVVFFTRAVNELTRPDSEGFIGGFFWARDLFPIADCAMSNAGELFFILAPDPNAEASHIQHSRDRVFRQGVATLGHEFEHLINAGRRIYVNTTATDFEESWLDEGLAHLAEELIFYAASGLGPESNLDIEDVRSTEAIRDAINRYGVQNLARYALYLEDVTGESPTNTRDRLETRGAAWSFLRYAADHSERPNQLFFRLLVDTPLTGFTNLEAVLDDSALDWLQRWGVSVYTDDLVQTGEPLLQQLSWNFRSLLPVLIEGDFPLVVETLAPGETESLTLVSGTSGYVEVSSVAGRTSRLLTTSGSAAPPNDLRVTVVRVE